MPSIARYAEDQSNPNVGGANPAVARSLDPMFPGVLRDLGGSAVEVVRGETKVVGL